MDDFEQLDYYELLAISRNASAEEIKQAYRQQMRRYHPDRVSGTAPEEQAYAGRRALRINEAYQALSDVGARAVYTRRLGGKASAPPRQQPTPQIPRDHQAELYDRARAHIDAGRTLQAVATLRELQQLNPFYRDSAALLAQVDAAPPRKPAPPPAPPRKPAPPPAPPSSVPDRNRRALLIGGVGSVLFAAVGGAAWWLRRTPAAASPTSASALEPTSAVAIAAATPTATPEPAPTSQPTATPTAAPPTATPTAAPTATPARLAEEGQLLYSEGFRSNAWPSTSGSGWSVAEDGGAYVITTARGLGNIWAYRTSPAGKNMFLGVDVEVSGGEAGLVLRFSDASNYLAFLVDPQGGSFRVEQRLGGRPSPLIDERHRAVLSGPDASNRLAARLEGDQIDLRINGQRVAKITLAAPPPSNQYGFVAVAGDGSVEATFRDLGLRALVP